KAAEAAEALSACVALQPGAPWGYSVRGLAQVAARRFAEAAADLDQAIHLSRDFRLPRLNRGVAYWLQPEYDEALAGFEALLGPPDSQRLIEGLYYRGQVQLERGRYKEALASFDEVVSVRRTFQSLHLFRARCLFSLGRQAQALEALDAFLSGRKGFVAGSADALGQRGSLLP